MKKKKIKYTDEDYKIDFLYAFPKYRCLLKELDSKDKNIKLLERNKEYYRKRDIENKLIIKQKNRIIFRLRKKLKELEKK